MKILHTGDIHLDSPFSSTDPMKSEIQRRELRGVFSDMMSYASSEGVDMVLIAGDFFDNSFVTRETISIITKELEAVCCPVIIAPGNHDPADENSIWQKNLLPQNVYVFTKSELESFTFDELGCTVYGYAFTSPSMRECPLDGNAAMDNDKINIICAHGDTASPISTYCPITPAAIRDFGADYCALGHIHSPAAANEMLEKAGLCAMYCGCPQGRDFGETGVRGARLVTITKENKVADVSVRDIVFSKKIYETAEVSVDGATTMAEVISEVRAYITSSGYGEDTLLLINLRGFVASTLVILCDEIEKECAATLFSLIVTDSTVPSLSAEELKLDRGIRGEVYRLLLPKIENGTPDERRAAIQSLRYALAALAGEALI